MDQNPYESPSGVKPTEPPPIEPPPSGASRMDGPELFGVLVRAIGLYFILTGIVYAIQAMFYFSGVLHNQEFGQWYMARGAVEWLAPGIVAFFLSGKIVRLAYSDKREQPPEEYARSPDTPEG